MLFLEKSPEFLIFGLSVYLEVTGILYKNQSNKYFLR